MENGKGKTTSMYTFWKTSFKAPEEECSGYFQFDNLV